MKLEDALTKEKLSVGLEKREIFNGYSLVDETVSPKIQLNPAVPAMLIKSISQFVNKEQNELIIEDAISFYSAINKMFLEKDIGNNEAKQIKSKYNLSFFGIYQYNLLSYFIQKLKI